MKAEAKSSFHRLSDARETRSDSTKSFPSRSRPRCVVKVIHQRIATQRDISHWQLLDRSGEGRQDTRGMRLIRKRETAAKSLHSLSDHGRNQRQIVELG